MAASGYRGGFQGQPGASWGVETKDPLPGCGEFMRDFADRFGQAFPVRPGRYGLVMVCGGEVA